MRRLMFGCVVLFLTIQSSLTQNLLVVSGVVRDSATGEALPRVSIMLTDSSIGTVSQKDGSYQLALPRGRYSLRFNVIGYASRTLELNVQHDMRLDVELVPGLLQAEEVSVTAERPPLAPIRSLNAVNISPARTAAIASPFKDVYRALQTLPGIASNNEMSSQFGVRGGTMDENLVLLGGVQLLDLFHLKESPNTSASVINSDILGKIIFSPGGFTARYGDRLSSVLDLDVREGNNKQLSGNLDVSLTGGALVAEGPLSPSVTGLASVRSTFSNYVSRYLPNGSSRNPSYYDALARTDIVADERNHVSLQVLRSYDKTSGIARGEYGTTLISLQAHHALGQSDTLQGTISTTWQSENLSRPLGIFDPKTGNNVSTISDIIQKETSLQYQASVTKQYAILMGGRLQRSGYQGTRISVVRTLRGDSVSQGDLDHEMTRASGFVENIVQIDRVLVNGGVRLDYASLIDEAKVSPRFLISYRFPSSTTIKGACGVYYQSPNYQQLLAARSSSLPFPHMQRATHYTIGLEQPLRSDLSLRIDAYIKTMEDVISFERFRSGEIIYSPRNDARANVKGVEFEASFSDPKVFGWMNVAVMRAEERNYYDSFGWRFSPTDQRKTVTLVFELRPAERFSMNIRAFYGSGFAYLNDAPDSLIDPRKHYPEYKRADVRASYTIKFSDRLSSTIYLEAMNIFGYRNAYSFRGAITDPSNPDVNLLLPTIINVGVRADF